MPVRHPQRRAWLHLALAALGILLAASAPAAPPTQVDIIAFRHPPVEKALKPLRAALAARGARVQVHEIDMESPQARQRLAAVGLEGHIPVVILVDGRYQHRRADGRTVSLTGFPSGPDTPTGGPSGWRVEDVLALVEGRAP